MQLRVLLCWTCFCGLAYAQVFDKSPTASSGVVDEGTGQALYGGFGLNAADGPAYQIYRKYGQRDPDVPLQEAENVPGNPSAMTWTGLHHTGGSGIIDPGMWIATTPGTMSPPDQLLYMRPLIDEDGGGNGDTNFRHDWDVRFGFLEDPTAFIESRDPNSEAWDLWSGEWDTDGISAQLNIGTNDTFDEEEWYTRMGSGFRLNAKDDIFDHEGGRDAHPMDRTYAGSADELLEGMGDNALAGVGYDDAIEISWKLEELSPREVEMTIKVGNIIHKGVFDPGTPDDPVAPNTDGEDFSGGFFDWKNSTPVFFVAAQGGSIEAFGTMGVFIPGDVNTDGVKDSTDREILTSFIGQIDTTYSRGDIDQDGDTDNDDLALWDSLGVTTPGDYNRDQMVDVVDVDLQAAAMQDANPDLTVFDENDDGKVDIADRQIWVNVHKNTWFGDSNLDGEFNSSDLVAVFTAGKYDTPDMASWGEGDWNGDARFDSGDLVTAFQEGGFEVGPRPDAAAIPEPSSLVLALLSLFSVPWLRRCGRGFGR